MTGRLDAGVLTMFTTVAAIHYYYTLLPLDPV